MSALLDTSSLLNLVRFYLPFDSNNVLKNLFQQKLAEGELVIIDKVIAEARVIARGVILQNLPFITTKVVSTVNALPPSKFISLTDNQFCDQRVKRLKYSQEEYQVLKQDYLNSADAGLMIHAMLNKASNMMVISDESSTLNDGKLFKKIPVCCNLISVNCCTITDFMKNHLNINIVYS